jgi:hypothetical protein
VKEREIRKGNFVEHVVAIDLLGVHTLHGPVPTTAPRLGIDVSRCRGCGGPGRRPRVSPRTQEDQKRVHGGTVDAPSPSAWRRCDSRMMNGGGCFAVCMEEV